MDRSKFVSEIAPLSSFQGATRDRVRARLIAGTGVAIILTSFAAALLPLADGFSGPAVIGTMMVTAGLLEVMAGTVRLKNHFLTMLSGAVTVIAGLLFTIEPFDAFVPMVRLVIGWLAARGVILTLASFEARGSVRFWMVLAAATDLSLGAILLIGLSATTITIAFFGPTNEIVSSFAWVLALSFVATGSLLIEVGGCEGSQRFRSRREAASLTQ